MFVFDVYEEDFPALKARFTPEQGAMILQEPEAALKQLRQEQKNVSAET